MATATKKTTSNGKAKAKDIDTPAPEVEEIQSPAPVHLDEEEIAAIRKIRSKLIDFLDSDEDLDPCIYTDGTGGARIHLYVPRPGGGETSVLVTVEKDPDN